MQDESLTFYQIIKKDPRFPFEAYIFVREALAYASDCMELDFYEESPPAESVDQKERHLSGQQLCEAIRQYAINQFGYMAKIVLRNWGIDSTGCFGDIVYNMIQVDIMKKSAQDQRCHFDDVYLFDDVFQQQFEFCESLAHRRS